MDRPCGYDETNGRSAFHSWHYRHHFSYMGEQGKNIIVQCNLCVDKANLLSTSKTSTSNLKKHLDRKHLGQTEKREAANRGRKKSAPEANGDPTQNLPKKIKLEYVSPNHVQSKMDALIFNFVVEDCHSFSVLEQPGFKKLIEGVSGGRAPMNKTTLILRVEKTFSSMRAELVSKLEKVQFVCTTADIWTAHDRSFFAMTCHWIDEVSLKRRSAALCCVKTRGRHTYDTVAAKIHETHVAYNIESKVQTTLTDNGSRLAAVFKEFSIEDNQDDDDDTGCFENVGVILDGESEQDMLLFLPSLQRCASHTLDLIVSKDLWRALSQGAVCQMHYSTMAKCFAVWSKAHQFQVAFEASEEIASMPLVVPAVSRWNVEYCAVQKILALSERQLTELSARLETPRLQPQELVYLKEYIAVFKPLAFALSLFQAEQKCYLGLVIPTLLSLKKKLSDQKAAAQYFGDVIDAILVAIDIRFQELFSSSEAKMATSTCPQFRLWWLSPSEREDMCAQLVSEASLLESSDEAEGDVDKHLAPIESEEDFFNYGPVSKFHWKKRGVVEEVRKYAEGTSKSLECLQDFPKVKQLFLKYNTTLPSSAPVQRLFTHKEHLVMSQKNCLTDEYFERILLLRYNNSVCPLVT
ncbi:uncharacterized protein zbedx [Aplochiton taeniatus]